MTVKDLIALNLFELKNAGDDADMEREITRAFCCDLLSVAMGKAPAGCAWVTVMANINTLAVASWPMPPVSFWRKTLRLTK